MDRLSPAKTPEYRSWYNMKSRCLNPENKSYHNYGGRGIAICKRWMIFANFLADMGKRPKGTTLDRIKNDGNYKPGNCQWATREEQNGKKRNCRYVEVDGVKLCSAQWGKKLGFSSTTIYPSARRLGMTVQEFLERKVRKCLG